MSGLVLDSTTSAPIAGATVIARVSSEDVVADSDVTDGTGAYTLTLVPGSYDVTFTANGYRTTTYAFEVEEDTPLDAGAVGLEARTPPVNVTGSVRDEAGDPVAGVEVVLVGPERRTLTTEADGTFTTSVEPAFYNVLVNADGFFGYDNFFDLVDADNQVDITLTRIPDPVTFSGSVLDAVTTAGVADAVVRFYGPISSAVTTGPGGTFTTDLPPGYYEVVISAAGYDEFTTELDLTEQETEIPAFELQPTVPGIKVTVSNSTLGGYAVNAKVSLQPANGGSPAVVTTNQKGVALFTDLAPGAYTVAGVADDVFSFAGEPVTVDYVDGVASVEINAQVDLRCNPPSAATGLTNMGFESGFDGWHLGYRTESVNVTGTDAFTSPWEGNKMAVLGVPRDGDGERQPIGPNIMCQDFVVDEAKESFAFNIFTYDYTGFDSFNFDVIVSDPATGETLAAYEQGAFGSGTELKTSGWRGVELDLADHLGDTVRLTFRAGGTSDDLYAFWTYLDSAGELPPTIETPVSAVDAETGSVTTDPVTGQVMVSMPSGAPSPVTISLAVSCADEQVPTAVNLLLNGIGHPASDDDGNGTYSATIPVEQVSDGTLSAEYTCPGETTVSTVIGQIVLYDPSGTITDKETGEPVVGAEVRLYKVPGWSAQDADGPHPVNSCQSNLSKEPGTAWNQPAPTDLGELVKPASPEISPNVNPFVTNNAGYYGWDVAAGCWYVQVTADGYEPLTSPVVGVPPEVTDLDLELTPKAGSVENTAPPAVSGAPKVDQELTAAPGEWNTDGLTFTYQWFRGTEPITDADQARYTVAPADVAEAITVRVTAKKDGYADGVATSAAVTGQLADAPTNTKAPAISGIAKAGAELTAVTGGWSLDGLTYDVQWHRDGNPIAGATTAKYKVAKADVGKKLTITVATKRNGYATATATSAPVIALESDSCTWSKALLTKLSKDTTAAKKGLDAANKKVKKLAKQLKKAKKAAKASKAKALGKKLKKAKRSLKKAKKTYTDTATKKRAAASGVSRNC
ncbi:carboxypeptidase regulatory-like domain-containing protein [Nocardioides sp. zg-536]|uniref:Carboxypeptidase regulatory-like domain-containing protein n=1 Tax=Nocardioides faecalis TaxID=2803858 RepID=A0A938Y379_9ACTN|nr:carboxypeptidase regulatory-like domain-containing protein [Nocardioides faecalis]MBM9458405.1 carboxypeptidase regulatory-like domain-containing protein [Nocardioides faecalis]QVI58424.1 carboxypeptidase regulatory-like domain-containing protein [Nocardioides faecalis]